MTGVVDLFPRAGVHVQARIAGGIYTGRVQATMPITCIDERFRGALARTGAVIWFEDEGQYATEVWCPLVGARTPGVRAALWPLFDVPILFGVDALALRLPSCPGKILRRIGRRPAVSSAPIVVDRREQIIGGGAAIAPA